ncbi:Thymidylate synthase [Fontibacillus panacisegetis]|uniref:Thymidylate synthase n=1 Tax=Fontibacillus panacisegetis TaxID=670482 RepID=A0A1G7Q0S1_9BACL|nr:thymidylate synthase [Fontibacillus panacisegetis]SDF91519.1 Thymidylate synthase [Fontibacillus panacisegetis]
MHVITSENITDAFYKILKATFDNGTLLNSWKGTVKEISPLLVSVNRPNERCLIVPNLLNNTIASIAETLWVIAGRDDMKFLKKYVHNAMDFSDDGITWRAAYGKRLVNFHSINQVDKIYEIISKKYSNRGPFTIYDPLLDFNNHTKDVPCTCMGEFNVTDNQLEMIVIMRSSDLIAGFSAANYFEWSFLHELMANWLNLGLGKFHIMIGNMALFERHFGRAKRIIQTKIEKDIYTFPNISQMPIDLSRDDLSEELGLFFEIESSFDNLSDYETLINLSLKIKSRFLQHALKILYCYELYKKFRFSELIELFDLLDNDVYKAAAADYFIRKSFHSNIKMQLIDRCFNEEWRKYYA